MASGGKPPLSCPLGNSRDAKCKAYNGLLKSYHLKQHIVEPTRVTESSRTIIDHICSNREDLYCTFGVLDCGISDHSLVFTTRKKAKNKKDSEYVWARSYRKYDPISFEADIANIDWSAVLGCDHPDEALDHFYNAMFEVIDIHAPYKEIKCTRDRPNLLG